MRRWFMILMIVLLPFRAWAGDAMAIPAVGSTDQGSAMTALANNGAQLPCHASTADAPALSADPHDTTAAHEAGSHVAHLLCDICNGPVLAPALPDLSGPDMVHARHLPPAEQFLSAWPTRDSRPPIA